MLTKDEIIARQESKVRPLEVPEWGGSILIRPLLAGEVLDLSGILSAVESEGDMKRNIEAAFSIVAFGVVTDDGRRMFSGPEELRDFDIAAITRIAQAIADLSNLSTDANSGK